MSRSRKSNSSGDIALIVTILLIATSWTQREFIVKILAIAYLAMTAWVFLKLLNKLNNWQRSRCPDMKTIDNMSGLAFEHYVVKLLKSHGYTQVRLTEKYDLGIDIVAYKDGTRWGIQVKRHKGLVKAAAVRQVVTALRTYDCDRAMVITNSTFSRVARELASSNDCVLVDRSVLSQLT